MKKLLTLLIFTAAPAFAVDLNLDDGAGAISFLSAEETKNPAHLHVEGETFRYWKRLNDQNPEFVCRSVSVAERTVELECDDGVPRVAVIEGGYDGMKWPDSIIFAGIRMKPVAE